MFHKTVHIEIVFVMNTCFTPGFISDKFSNEDAVLVYFDTDTEISLSVLSVNYITDIYHI